LAVVVGVLAGCQQARADIWKEGKDPVALPFQPRLEKLANRDSRVYGRWDEDPLSWREGNTVITTTDLIVAVDPSGHFLYSDNTKALNGFLQEYAALKQEPISIDRPPCLIIHAGRALLEKGHSYDWKMNWAMHLRKKPDWEGKRLLHGVATVEVWLGGQVKLDDLKVPTTIKVKSGGEIEKFITERQGVSTWQGPAVLPELNKDSSKGLKIECHSSKAEYRVGDRVYVVCKITNETDGIKPIAWNANVGSHFTLIQGDKFSLEGLLPKAHPEIPKPLLVKSGHPPTTERILYLPSRDSIIFHLSVGKAQGPLIFKGRVAYDPLAPRATFRIDPKKRRDECLYSDLFTYEVVDAERKQATLGESKASHGIGLYLLQDAKMGFETARKTSLSELVLPKEPWIASEDIERYDATTHRIYLRKKFPTAPWKNLLSGGTPFVAVANGEPCYLGTLWSSDSSSLPPGNVPVITDVPPWNGGGQPDAIEISLISVLRSGEDVVDVRSDPRVLKAVREHHSGDAADSPARANGQDKPGASVAGRIAAYVARFEESDARLLRALPKFKERQLKSKESGWKPPWEGYKNVKDRAYYEKLTTADLAKECFSTSLWARDMFIYDHAAYGIVRAEVFHDGFSVLYERPDFWEGIASVYRHLAQELAETKVDRRKMGNPEALSVEERRQMDILFNLQTLKHAYTFPRFRERLKGREKLLLQANLEALRAVLSYAKESGRRDGKPFWGAGVAYGLSCPMLALLKRMNPDKYSEIIGRLEKTELSFKKPDPKQVESYIRLVISTVEQALAEEEAQAEDTAE
jgi:hypothetical protein